MNTISALLPFAADAPPASADAADVRLTGCATVVLIIAELVAVVAICVAEVSPRRLHGNAASHDTS